MQPTQKAPIVLAAVLFILAAVAEMAMGRSRSPQDDRLERARVVALASVDEALAHGDRAAAHRRRSRSSRSSVSARSKISAGSPDGTTCRPSACTRRNFACVSLEIVNCSL